VLFADLAGFTHMCETLSPPQVMDLLRRFRGRMEHAVFANGGTLDKYIGDAVMATFGTPHPGRRDASNTVRCAIAMVEALEHWNEERAAQGQPRLRLGVGADYGPCMVGDIGGEARLEFTVIGDTVNVASRLEELSRTLASDVVISDTLAEAVRAEGQGALIDTFVASAPLHVRLRDRRSAPCAGRWHRRCWRRRHPASRCVPGRRSA
jgi:adenylate cyclase